MTHPTAPPSLSAPADASPNPASGRVSRGAWMALLAAILGWMFDGMEMGLFPLVANPALTDLLNLENADQQSQIGLWLGIMIAGFLVGAATGGVLFGWLGDRIGRVRAMTLSVLTYALFTGLCGVAANEHQIFWLRFIASLGMGGEWSLGVSLVMEIWPNRSRAWLAGLIGAASNVGFTFIAVVSLGLSGVIGGVGDLMISIGVPEQTRESLLAHSGWRLLMFFGAAPALLTFLIRLFVPESEKWTEERGRGATSHWATKDLIGVLIGACGPLATIYIWNIDISGWAGPLATPIRVAVTILGLAVALAGYLFPVVRYLRRSAAEQVGVKSQVGGGVTLRRMLLGACLSGVALLGTWGSLQWAPAWAATIEGTIPSARAYTQIASGIGAILGTIGAALLGDLIGRRAAYLLLCIGALGSALLFFQTNESFGAWFLVSVFLAGGLTASFYGWLPLYLPELFPTRVRATGQGFAFNFGRILAAIGTLQTGLLMKDVFKDSYPNACSTMSAIYVVGMVIIWLAPETKGKPLPE